MAVYINDSKRAPVGGGAIFELQVDDYATDKNDLPALGECVKYTTVSKDGEIVQGVTGEHAQLTTSVLDITTYDVYHLGVNGYRKGGEPQ